MGTFVFSINCKRENAAKIVMLDAARVNLQVALVGFKCKDADNPADLNMQAGNIPPETRARRVLAKGGCGRSIDKGGSDEEGIWLSAEWKNGAGQLRLPRPRVWLQAQGKGVAQQPRMTPQHWLQPRWPQPSQPAQTRRSGQWSGWLAKPWAGMSPTWQPWLSQDTPKTMLRQYPTCPPWLQALLMAASGTGPLTMMTMRCVCRKIHMQVKPPS
jgi:hypothetical protein